MLFLHVVDIGRVNAGGLYEFTWRIQAVSAVMILFWLVAPSFNPDADGALVTTVSN